MGTKDGSIIATIIRPTIPRNDAAAPGHVCPGIRIHAIDIVQPRDRHPAHRRHGLAPDDRHRRAGGEEQGETPRKTRCENSLGKHRKAYSIRRRCRIVRGAAHCIPAAFRTNSAGSAALLQICAGQCPRIRTCSEEGGILAMNSNIKRWDH